MKIPLNVKLIIWDLDDTFWHGTLAEGDIKPVPDNIKKIIKLCERGIMHSISSKNDFIRAQQKLLELGIWDYFVFPSIAFEPKAYNIQHIIEVMQLRANDVVFIDDNHHNRAEAKALIPELFVVHPRDILPYLENLAEFNGKAEPQLTRLAHYKLLEKKQIAKAGTLQSNTEFLRQSQIQICFDYDYKSNIDRIFELIERTNQLNFTKVRLSSETDKSAFLKKLEHFQYSSAVVKCRDKYGDYGIVGFYLLRTTYFGLFLEHYVFSCRAMHMGIEDFVYQYLKCPKLEIKEPVAYGLNSDLRVDWITLEKEFDSTNSTTNVIASTLLLGPCNLLQASNYLGGSVNFLHTLRNETCIRFDCPGFFLSDAVDVKHSDFLDGQLIWNKQEFFAFQENVKTQERIVLDLFDFMVCESLGEIDGLYFRPEFLSEQVQNTLKLHPLSINQRLALVKKCVFFVIEHSKGDACIFILNRVFNVTTKPKERGLRLAYDRFIQTLVHPKLHLVPLNALLDKSAFDDGLHLNRSGYFALAESLKTGQIPVWEFDYNVYDFKDDN